MPILRVAFFMLAAVCVGFLHAAEPYIPQHGNLLHEPWRWQHFPELEGKGVRCIAEDNQGTVWFGVNDGLIEYNGYQWKWHTEKNGLLGSPVEQIYTGVRGHIYATTARGVFKYANKRWQRIFSLEGSPGLTFHQLREWSNGSLALCTQLGMIEIRPDKSFRIFTSAPNRTALSSSMKTAQWVMLPEEILQQHTFLDISDVLEYTDGQYWMSVTLQGFSRILQFNPEDIRGERLSAYSLVSSGNTPTFGETQKMLRAHDQSIWVINTSPHVGIHRFVNNRWEYTELSTRFGGDEYTTALVQSADGTIWIGALGRMYTYKAGVWELYKSPDFKIPANSLMLARSHDNNIWIGGHKSKVFRLDYSPSRWMTYKDLNFQCESADGTSWFLEVQGRVLQKMKNRWTAYTTSDGLMDSPVRVIVTSTGQVWAAGSHNGVAATAYFEGGSWHRQLHPKLSWGIDYRAVFEARDGSLWFGGGVDFFRDRGQLGGVLQLKNPNTHPFKWTHHKYHENGLLQSNAYGIGQSADGRIWIGGGNLYYFDGQTWDRPDQNDLRQFVNIVQSTGNLLLVGSRYYGLFTFDGKKWTQYHTESGLASNTIISVHADSPKSIWVATENDIAHFDGKRWVNHLFPEQMNMDLEGGAILRSRDGAIWLNKASREWKRQAFRNFKMPAEAARGFVAYRYHPDHNPPDTRVDLFTPEVSPEGNMLVRWSGEDFFGDTPDERLLFSYRLNGGTWSAYTEETAHAFMDLASGAYTLEVRVRDLDLNVDPTPARVQFTVRQPVWKQGWFISLVLAFLLIIGIFEYRIITKKQTLEKLNVQLHTINTELQAKNDQVVSQRAQILEQKEALEESHHNLEEQHQEIQLQHDQLEQMVEQIETLSKSKMNFFTNISHELRTPLTLILGPVEQLRHPTGYSEPDRNRLLEVVERNAYRLLKLINQLLEMRRIEDQSLALTLSKGNLAQYLAEICELFDHLARAKQIHLSFQNQCQNALAAFDPDKVEKMISNLLSNAFKHTPEGGSITVTLTKNDSMEAPVFRIQVADTGAGISPQKLDRIFDRYYSSATDQMSTGIGLSYIRELAELHGGEIDVTSIEGRGTCFAITLPATLTESIGDLEKIPTAPTLTSTHWEISQWRHLQNPASGVHTLPAPLSAVHRILVVEDNPDMLAFLTTLLQRRFTVLKAANGMEGLRLASTHPLDLILTDIMMPEMDGLQFCTHIKSNFATSHIPVILLTARNMEEYILEGYETGADDYITKPFNPQILEARIDNLLQQRENLRKKFNRDFELTPREVELTSPDEALLNRIVEIMEAHISDSEFNVNRMCEMVHLSHMQFIRKVKQLTGKKPIDLLKSYRLKRAKDLLTQNKVNISEIAYMVGYDLPNSFSRAFKKEFECSPSEFIESLGQVPVPMRPEDC